MNSHPTSAPQPDPSVKEEILRLARTASKNQILFCSSFQHIPDCPDCCSTCHTDELEYPFTSNSIHVDNKDVDVYVCCGIALWIMEELKK